MGNLPGGVGAIMGPRIRKVVYGFIVSIVRMVDGVEEQSWFVVGAGSVAFL